MILYCSHLTKYTNIKDHPLLETALFFLMSYSTFQASEAAGLTGKYNILVYVNTTTSSPRISLYNGL